LAFLVGVAVGSGDGDPLLVGCAVDCVAATLGARVGAFAVVVGLPPSLETAKAPPARRAATTTIGMTMRSGRAFARRA
jgi:hypothetical protein